MNDIKNDIKIDRKRIQQLKRERERKEVSENQESDYTKSLRVMRDFTVTFADGTSQTVTANRFYRGGNRSDPGEVTFEGTPGSPFGTIAYFRNVVSVVPAPAKMHPAPVNGTEYYTVADIQQALIDLGYHSTDVIVKKLGEKLSVRDDGRYTLDELKKSLMQIEYISGDYYIKKMDQAALQARKNRVWEAHGGS